ncbi:unnamed protein product [Cyprideis torosa]|uniref:Uncharacterized protein n=1 Tax=Cyprideis torosa TaxID=163714 RepID=A0A7R8ZMJ9_9CRUS|nr:unnamed protein product [Cyprideis torosa]CAG0884516.1 unnamed protein product [Cyprideis torosa]
MVTLSDYVFEGHIGPFCAGSGFAYVVRKKDDPERTSYALKLSKLDRISDAKGLDFITHLLNEVRLSRQLQHPNIMPILSTFVDGSNLCSLSPHMDYRSAADLISQYFCEGLPEVAICYIMKRILKAVEYLHQNGFIHRNIRAGHIMLSSSGSVALAGLGHACVLSNGIASPRTSVHDFPSTSSRSLLWLAPEILAQNLDGYNEKSDIYSVGLTCCEMANGNVPYADLPNTLLLLQKLTGPSPCLLDASTVDAADAMLEGQTKDSGVGDSDVADLGSSLQHKSKRQDFHRRMFSASFHAVVNEALTLNPRNRPSARELLTRSFFRKSLMSSFHNKNKAFSLSSMLRGIPPPKPDQQDGGEGSDDCPHNEPKGLLNQVVGSRHPVITMTSFDASLEDLVWDF